MLFNSPLPHTAAADMWGLKSGTASEIDIREHLDIGNPHRSMSVYSPDRCLWREWAHCGQVGEFHRRRVNASNKGRIQTRFRDEGRWSWRGPAKLNGSEKTVLLARRSGLSGETISPVSGSHRDNARCQRKRNADYHEAPADDRDRILS